MEIYRSDLRPTRRGQEEYFTGGPVYLDEIVASPEPARARILRVTFTPGARTAWHTHPLGQVLHVLSGIGLVQKEGEPVHTIRPGDTVWILPGEKHWHGARPDQAMVHLAEQEADAAGQTAVWLEPVSDEDYLKPPVD